MSNNTKSCAGRVAGRVLLLLDAVCDPQSQHLKRPSQLWRMHTESSLV